MFSCHFTHNDGSHISNYCTINETLSGNAKFKNSAKMFSPESDIDIINYDATNVLKDLYCIHTDDSSTTYFANDIIVKCNLD